MEPNPTKNKKPLIIGVAIVAVLLLVGTIVYAVLKFMPNDESDSSSTETSQVETPDSVEPVTTHSDGVPADLPEDTPQLEGADLLDAMTMTMGSETKEYSLMYQTDKSADEVFAFYKNAFSTGGWQTHVVRSEDNFNAIAASNTAKNLNANFSSSKNTPNGSPTAYTVSISVMMPPSAPEPR